MDEITSFIESNNANQSCDDLTFGERVNERYCHDLIDAEETEDGYVLYWTADDRLIAWFSIAEEKGYIK